MNKKGILVGEALRIILAVVSIGLLIYLAVSLVGLLNYKGEIEQAKASLSEIISLSEELDESQSVNYFISSPENWYLIFAEEESYVPGDYLSKRTKLPDECKENCLCICPKKTSTSSAGVGAPGITTETLSCDEGYCVNQESVVEGDVVEGIKLREEISLKKEGGKLIIDKNEK